MVVWYKTYLYRGGEAGVRTKSSYIGRGGIKASIALISTMEGLTHTQAETHKVYVQKGWGGRE